jgi:hypothetical protein
MQLIADLQMSRDVTRASTEMALNQTITVGLINQLCGRRLMYINSDTRQPAGGTASRSGDRNSCTARGPGSRRRCKWGAPA